MDLLVDQHHDDYMNTIKLSIVITLLFLVGNRSFAAIPDSTKCKESKGQAQSDLKKNKIHFMLQGGFAPVHIAGQEIFEEKYHIKYFDLGCVVPNDLCIAHYNAEVAKYLDKTYGKSWRKEVRKDVLGLFLNPSPSIHKGFHPR